MSGAVLVFGCHRSGTSLLASCVSGFGFDFGGLEPLEADVHNPRGYFECGRSNGLLNGVAGFPPRFDATPYEARVLWGEYLGLLSDRVGDARVGLKETRLVYHPVLVDEWLRVWPDTRCVFVERGREAVVASLDAFMGVHAKNRVHTECAQAATHKMFGLLRGRVDCLFVSFEEFVRRPERQLLRLARFLGEDCVPDGVSGLFDESLVHHG